MERCEACGNEYEDLFEVKMHGKSHKFDCFECAIAVLAPECAECGVRILGHGVSIGGDLFCSAHCSRAYGLPGAKDHVFVEEIEEIVGI